MHRNQNPFTNRQLRLLEAIRAKIQEINDPNPEVIRHESYEFYTSCTKKYGNIIKIRFHPRISTRIKAELAESSGLYTENRRKQIADIRKQCGIKMARNVDAMLFEEEWNGIAFKLKRAMYITGLINFMFVEGNYPLAEPCRLMQEIILAEYPTITVKRAPIHAKNAEPTESKGIRPYTDELAECD